MRILQVVQKPQRRGAEVFAQQLSRAFEREGHDVTTAYLYPQPLFNSLEQTERDLILGANENHFSEKIPGWNFRILKAFANILKSFQPHIVQLNGARTLKYGTILRFRTAKNPVIIYRNIGDPKAWRRGFFSKFLYESLLIPKLDGIVAVSSAAMKTFQKQFHSRPRVVHIPTGVNLKDLVVQASRSEVRRSLNTPLESPVIIFVGSLTSEKRVDLLFKIFVEASKAVSSLHLWIAGDGPLRKIFETQAAELGIAGSVRFLGSRKDIASLLNASDLFALTSQTEGVPAVVLESAVFSLPAVAFDVGGLPDCICSGETGFLVPFGNASEMAEKIAALAMNASLRKEMGENAKRWVIANFGLDTIAKDYLSFYGDLLAQRSQVSRIAVHS